MPNIVVTGGCGFIGHHLVKQLSKNPDNNIIIVDNLSTGKISRAVGFKHYLGISEFVDAYTSKKIKIDQIYHLGMASSSPMYTDSPSVLLEVIEDMTTLLELMRNTNIKLVLASTSSLYNGNRLPYTENMQILPTDFYTEARLYCERLIQVYHNMYGVKANILRLFSVYGEGEESKGKYANMVTQFRLTINQGKSPVVYGDGTQSRDFIHVSDVVTAMQSAMSKDFDDVEIFNVGTGRTHNFIEVIDMLQNGTKHIASQFIKNPIPNYVQHTQADIDKASQVLEFVATVRLKDWIRDGCNKNEGD